ncbi:MAG: homoserine kinase [Bifidobacteriaceae bacterium]|jgi:homoserine kinase|nr:homoserine kinase [Bifidobacteriaceae bacterium]
MRFAADHVRVEVPATSANLGPGFDSLGLALDLWDRVEARAVSGPSRVSVVGEGAGELPTDGRHLVVRAAQRALEIAGAPPVGLELSCVNAIPQSKGLGSSASAVAAGALIARGLIANPAVMNAGRVFRLTTDFEGHPDNAAPAVFGGATVAWMSSDGSAAGAARLAVHPDLRVVVLLPDFTLATSVARAALPARVPHRDAVFNASRAALLVHAIASDPALLLQATEDRLHQPYRAEVMPRTAELVAELRAAGFAAVISGAGPAVLVLTTDPAAVPEPAGWRWRAVGIAERGGVVARLD